MRPLVDPVWVLLLLLSLGTFLIPKNAHLHKIFIATSKFVLGFLIFLSTGVATFIFDAMLANESSPPKDWKPEFQRVNQDLQTVLDAIYTRDFVSVESWNFNFNDLLARTNHLQNYL